VSPPIEPGLGEAPSRLRVRAGVNTGVMYFLPGPSYGASISARFGVHFGDALAAYVDFGSGFGLGRGGDIDESSVSFSVSATNYWRVGIMGEAALGPFFVAAGPALLDGSWVGVSQSGGSSGASQEVYAVDGYCPAALARVGLSTGSRSKFTLALEGLVAFAKVTKVSQSGGTQSVKSGNMKLAYSPTLVVGWDL
jgi:hypothetical protein